MDLMTMTDDAILALPAGRDMDALIAECVFKQKPGVDFGAFTGHDWRRDEQGQIDPFAWSEFDHNGPSCRRCGYNYCVHCFRQDPLPGQLCVIKPPPYSQQIGMAWDVFQHERQALFSQRTRFFRYLGDLLQQPRDRRDRLRVCWPEAMMFLTPVLIAHAALLSERHRDDPL